MAVKILQECMTDRQAVIWDVAAGIRAGLVLAGWLKLIPIKEIFTQQGKSYPQIGGVFRMQLKPRPLKILNQSSRWVGGQT